ncbi:hypothetical protein V2J09_001927 [Rumex salicifolius]
MAKKSKILIVGATGNLGKLLTMASLESSHPTFAFVRDSAFSDPLKSRGLQSLSDLGAILLKVRLSRSISCKFATIFACIVSILKNLGSLEDEESLFEAVKQVDVVISAVSSKQIPLQTTLIRAIKRAGSIKVSSPSLEAIIDISSFFFFRFFPAEFGSDPDKNQISDLESDFRIYSRRVEIRRLVESEGIPYTYICNNYFMSYFLPSLLQPGLKAPPRDKVTIFGDGNAKGVFVKEIDVASFTISAVDDPRTLNKVMYLRPPGNVYSMNELVELWESKIGKKLDRTYIPEEEMLRKIREIPYPDNFELIFIYAAFVKGDHTYFDIDSTGGVEGTQLYPQIKYTKISEFLDTLL